ncbi:outer membrane protein assembly factor [Leptotrichia sp. HSP-342]|uniref:Outer membrane protein assembly factor n=1 Tax=Leptotrichia mesophila TaxID=3239303 RepID=A0AB39VBE7_9FUSO
MSKQEVRNKIYALIVVVTLFVSVNNVSQAEEKGRTIGTSELADNKNLLADGETETEIETSATDETGNLSNFDDVEPIRVKGRKIKKSKRSKRDTIEAQQAIEQKVELKVGTIEVSNLNEISADTILEKIPVKSGDNYSNKSLSDIYLAVKRLGYIAEANVIPQVDGDTVNILIQVSEVENAEAVRKRLQMREDMKKETEFTVARIEIEGTKIKDKQEYLKDLPVKLGDIFIPQKAIDGAQKIFQSGYFASVEPKINRRADNTVEIIYEVQENPIIQNINFEGNTLYTNEQLERALGVKRGEILNSNMLNPDENGVIKLYSKDGYTLARIESINVSPEGVVNMGLTEGMVDSVEFQKAPSKKDNERQSLKATTLRTKPYIFERVQEVKPGEIFKRENVENTMRELYKTGIFTSIEPVLSGKEDDPNARAVEFLVEERSTTTINGSISYGTSVGLVGELKLSDSNFLGRGQDASITLSASNKGDKTFDISWFDPWVKNTERVQIGGNIYWNESVNDNADRDEVEKVRKSGTRWTIGKGLNSNLYVRLAARYDRFKELLGSKEVNDKYNLLAIGPSLIYDTRNNSYSPSKGIYSTMSYERGKLIGDSRKYDQFETDLRAYHPTFFGDKNVMAYRVAWGSTGSGTPEALKFSIGGAESVRGYEYGAFDGYDKFHATIENRTKINDTLQLVAFFDIGNAWQNESRDPRTGKRIYKPNRKDAHDFKDLKKGYGVGVRLNTPIGPLRFDYGWPMDPEKKGEKKDKGKFYFSFGQSF